MKFGYFKVKEVASLRPIFTHTRIHPWGGYDRKTTTLLRDHEYFISTTIHENPSSGSGQEVENANS